MRLLNQIAIRAVTNIIIVTSSIEIKGAIDWKHVIDHQILLENNVMSLIRSARKVCLVKLILYNF